MSMEMPVIPVVYRVVDPKKNNWKKWRTKEKKRHKGSLTPKMYRCMCYISIQPIHIT
jgi:hypothetical protein